MKKLILKSILFLFFTLVFIQCNKQLDLKPLGQLTEDTFFQTEEDFESASLAPYATLLSFYYEQDGGGWYQPILARLTPL